MAGMSSNVILASLESPVDLLRQGQERTAVALRDPVSAGKDIVLDISAYGTIPTGARRTFSFVEEMGGVEKIVNSDDLRAARKMEIPFRLSNSPDHRRAIFLSYKLASPSSLKGVRVHIPQPDRVFAPRESRIVPASIRMSNLFIISLLVGVSLPHGTFGNTADPGFAGTVALEYRVTPSISAMGVYSRHQFKSKFPTGSDITASQISAQAKYYIITAMPFDAFLNAGASNYSFNPGSTKVGFNAGVGGQFELSPMFGLIAAYNVHNISSNGTTTTFSSIQGGIYFAF